MLHISQYMDWVTIKIVSVIMATHGNFITTMLWTLALYFQYCELVIYSNCKSWANREYIRNCVCSSFYYCEINLSYILLCCWTRYASAKETTMKAKGNWQYLLFWYWICIFSRFGSQNLSHQCISRGGIGRVGPPICIVFPELSSST